MIRARWPLLVLCFIGVLAFALSWGAPVSVFDLGADDPAAREVARRIFLEVRPTRVLAGVLVGASLALAGASLQSVFRNPLAEPYLLGVSAGGALGATLAKAFPDLDFHPAFDTTSLFAFVGATGASFTIYALGRGGSTPGFAALGFDRSRLLLTGVALSAFLASLMSLVVAISAHADLARQITFWLLGGLGEARSEQLFVLGLGLLAGGGVLFASARDLNALRLGDEDAAGLGVEVGRLHARLLLVSSLLSAGAVACAGLIGFIGLLGPHLVRLLFGQNARVVMPAAALCGASLLVLCDALARGALSPTELPVGVVTALLGVPLFLFLAHKNG